jgi:hypothetical protein
MAKKKSIVSIVRKPLDALIDRGEAWFWSKVFARATRRMEDTDDDGVQVPALTIDVESTPA